MIFHFVQAGITAAGLASISTAAYLAQISPSTMPEVKDPFIWVFLFVVCVVVGGAGWVVRYVLTHTMEQQKALVKVLDRALDSADDLRSDLRRKE